MRSNLVVYVPIMPSCGASGQSRHENGGLPLCEPSPSQGGPLTASAVMASAILWLVTCSVRSARREGRLGSHRRETSTAAAPA